MEVKGHGKHSASFLNEIESAKLQIKNAEESMKKMDQEVKDFHNHMSSQMQTLMGSFSVGFAALEKAKKEELDLEQSVEAPKAVAQPIVKALNKPLSALTKQMTVPKTAAPAQLNKAKKDAKLAPTILAQQSSSQNQNQDLQAAINALLQQQKIAKKDKSMVQTNA